jgi:hypothetical protein
LYGSKEGGFNPAESRHLRKKKKDVSGCWFWRFFFFFFLFCLTSIFLCFV